MPYLLKEKAAILFDFLPPLTIGAFSESAGIFVDSLSESWEEECQEHPHCELECQNHPYWEQEC
jgi:hypothetical protein